MRGLSRLRGQLSTLRPAYLFSLPVLAGVTLEFGLGQLASPYNAGGRLPLLAVLQVLTVAVAFALLGALYLALRGRVRDETVRFALLAAVPVGALLGGLFLGWSRLSLGLDTTPLLPLRMGTAFMHITAVTVLLWLAVSGVRLHYERLEALARERDRLEELGAQAQRSLADLDVDALESVRDRILDGLAPADERDPQAILASLTATLDDIVRPLSRQLESQAEEWAPPAPRQTAPQRIDWRAAALDGMDPRLMNPFWLVVILNLFALPMNVGRIGPLLAGQFILVSFLVAWPLFALVRHVVVRLVGDARGRRRIAAFVIACVLCGLVLAAALLPLTLGGPQPLRYVYMAPVFTLLTAFVWGCAVAAQRQAMAAEAALLAVTVDLHWHIARARELHRQRRRALAHAVHGQVQAALAAGILEIAGAIGAGTLTDEQVRRVHRRIVEGVEQLDLRHVQPSPLDVLVTKVRATWAGLATVSLDVDADLARLLAVDTQCLITLNDLIPELAFNSIKHGAATDIRVAIRRIDERTVVLEVSDNGQSLTEFATSGMGSRLLDEASMEWHRRRTGGSTITTAVLAVDPRPVTEHSSVAFEGEPSRVSP